MADEQIYDFGVRLRQLREDRRLSRDAFAKKIGVSKETVYRYENNLQNPSLDRTRQIAVVLRTSVDYLVGLESEYTVKLSGLTKEQRDALNVFLHAFVDNQHNGG